MLFIKQVVLLIFPAPVHAPPVAFTTPLLSHSLSGTGVAQVAPVTKINNPLDSYSLSGTGVASAPVHQIAGPTPTDSQFPSDIPYPGSAETAPQTLTAPPRTSSNTDSILQTISASSLPSAIFPSKVSSTISRPIQETVIYTSTTTPLPRTNSTALSTQSKVAIGIAVPIAAITFITFGIYLGRKCWSKAQHGNNRTSRGQQPYLQQKAELEAIVSKERRRLYELRYENNGLRELGVDGEIHELPAMAHTSGSFVMMHELSAEEHAKTAEKWQ